MTIKQMKKEVLDGLENSWAGIVPAADGLADLSFEAVDEDGEFDKKVTREIDDIYDELVRISDRLYDTFKRTKKTLKQIRN